MHSCNDGGPDDAAVHTAMARRFFFFFLRVELSYVFCLASTTAVHFHHHKKDNKCYRFILVRPLFTVAGMRTAKAGSIIFNALFLSFLLSNQSIHHLVLMKSLHHLYCWWDANGRRPGVSYSMHFFFLSYFQINPFII